MKKGRDILLLIISILILIAMNYGYLDSFVTKKISNLELVEVERVIDGDTVVINGNSIRMLGINTPERKEYLYSEAKAYTENLVLNKTIKIERRGKDLYGRDLAYLFYNDENLNVKLVEEGYANYYFPEGKDSYYSLFAKAWEKCISKNKNLCEKSSNECGECISLSEWDVENQKVVFYNSCDFDCNLNKWTIKDEGRKKFVFGNFTLKSKKEVSVIVGDKRSNFEILYWKNQTYVWTNTGDTIFLRDNEGKLVLWKSY
jgi:endonuclease YncB( thermonuclease family)